jgi:hypothetical protein
MKVVWIKEEVWAKFRDKGVDKEVRSRFNSGREHGIRIY